jgi:hypothetical protein
VAALGVASWTALQIAVTVAGADPEGRSYTVRWTVRGHWRLLTLAAP